MGTDVQELAARAKRLVLDRDFAEAVRACRRLLLSRPDDVDTRLLLGRALIATERVDEARVEMMSLIRRHPETALAHRLLGESFLKANQPKRAEESLRRALELDPKDEEATELLEELAEDPPPISATVERWFDSAGVATIETPASFFDDGSGDRPATSPAQEAPPSIQLDPELAALAEGLAAMKSEDTVTSASVVDPDQDPVTDPEATAPPPQPADLSPSTAEDDAVPPAPTPPTTAAGAPARPIRKPKRTMMGMPAPQDAPAISFPPEKTSELLLDDLEQLDEDVAKVEKPKPSTSELDASDLELVDSKPIFVPLNDEPLEAEPTRATVDAGLEPLEEEATRLRGPVADEDEDESTRDVKPPAAPAAAHAIEAKPVAPRRVTLPPAPGPPPSAAPPGAFRPSATPGVAPKPAALPPVAAPASAAPPFGAPPIAGPPPVAAPIAGPRVAAPPVAAAPFPSPSIAGPPAQIAGPPAAAAPFVSSPMAAPPVGDAFGSDAFGGARVVTPAFGTPAAAPAVAPQPVETAPPSPPADFTPGAGPRPSLPQRRSLSTTASARALAWSGQASKLWARVRLLEDRLPNRKLFPLVLAAPVLLFALIVIAAMMYSDHNDDQEIAAAILAACDDSRGINIERAVARDEDEDDSDDESAARRAHLLAMSAYESGEQSHATQASELLSTLDDHARASVESRLARAYLGLKSGDVAGASQALAIRQAAEDPTGEVGHVHALIAFAQGDYARAAVEARAAVSLRPSSPRHRALLALAQAFDHHPDAALVDLSAQPGSTNDPAIRMAEARIRLLKTDLPGARAAASTLVEELATVANPRQRAWGRVVLGSAAQTAGDAAGALAQLRAGREEGVAADEELTLALAQGFADAGDASAAQELLAGLPEGLARPRVRAQVRAWVLLQAGNTTGAVAALASAGDSPRTAYLRGRVAEAQDDAASARRAYEAAMVDESEEVRSRIRLASMALRADDAPGAMRVLGPALERAPTDVEVVPVAAQVLVATGEANRAAEVIETAIAAWPDSYALTLASARVALARDRAEAAQATLETLTSNHQDDVDAWVLLGDAANAASHGERSKEAYEKALELQPGNVTALLGLLNIAIASSDAAAAHAALDQAASAGVSGRPLEIGRARLLVLEGAGAQATHTLRQLSRGSRDATLFAALGQAYLQSENSRRASSAFSRALRYDREQLDAHIGLATLGIHAGGSRLRRAAARIGTADRIVRAQGNAPRDRARVLTLRAEILYFGNGDLAGAAEQARAAIVLDTSVGDAHLLLATVLAEQGQAHQDELRAAMGCPAPPPEAFVRMALAGGADACVLAQHYITAAPRGSWAGDARHITAGCR